MRQLPRVSSHGCCRLVVRWISWPGRQQRLRWQIKCDECVIMAARYSRARVNFYVRTGKISRGRHAWAQRNRRRRKSLGRRRSPRELHALFVQTSRKCLYANWVPYIIPISTIILPTLRITYKMIIKSYSTGQSTFSYFFIFCYDFSVYKYTLLIQFSLLTKSHQ